MASRTITTLVGHRGWPAYWPENTLEGFAAAVATGARWLECDVQLSTDRVPFVCHDALLERTAGIAGEITSLSSAELDKVSTGEPARFGTRFASAKLPRLSSLLAWLTTQPAVKLFVEIKRQSLRHHGTQPVVDAVMTELRTALQQCVVISFDHACLGLAKQQGATTIGWAVETVTEQTAQQAADLRPDYLFTDEKLFTRTRTALPGHWHWITYHSENVARVLELMDQGAHMVETNDIGTLLADPRLRQS